MADDFIAVRREGTSMDCCDLHIFYGFAFPVVKLCAIILWDKVSNQIIRNVTRRLRVCRK
jgi:hypothetical protein